MEKEEKEVEKEKEVEVKSDCESHQCQRRKTAPLAWWSQCGTPLPVCTEVVQCFM